jgi:GcrA cell cycle regulator
LSAWTFEWNDEAIERLRKLRAAGFSTAEIGKTFGVSKNAIIGKLYRLKTGGDTARVVRTKRAYKAKPKTKQGADKWFKMEPLPPPPKPQANVPFTKSVLELGPRMCKWPQGDRNFLFCGEPQEPGNVYCPDHVAIAYNHKGSPLAATRRATQGQP